ncbi:MAG: apolipoprotein N-acyltransferase [Lentisphaeria bacterium]
MPLNTNNHPNIPEQAEPDPAIMARCLLIWRCLAAIVSGLLLSAAFPPLSWDWLIWFALIPLLLIPQPPSWWERLLVGFLWGYVHFASSLFWLNEVGFAAGWLLALYCALFPMAWYFLFSSAIWTLRQPASQEFPGAGLLYIHALPKTFFLCFFGAASWCALEWLRSWLFTGFPWNQFGISQFERIGILQTAAYTGVYGISFLIVLVNLTLTTEFCQALRRKFSAHGRMFPWHFLLSGIFLLPVCWWGSQAKAVPEEKTPVLIAMAVQGNLPQCRDWTEQEFHQALQAYISLTRAEAPMGAKPDLIVWPECAVPASLEYPAYQNALRKLQTDLQIPLLLGATNYRYAPENPEQVALFNSAFLLDKELRILAYYDKMHRVPFGEYVPGSKYLPWLAEWIGMGRDLTPGQAYTLFELPKGARAGINICFEDVFPEISRNFTLRGANMLMTITNDSWYNESAGARQHLSHVIFRAVECRRPFLRSGNNSDTCMISPNGEILGVLKNEQTGSPFVAGTIRFALPISDQWGNTFYTRFGNLFAVCCVIFTAGTMAGLFGNWFRRKRWLLQVISSKPSGKSP